jgi:HrpA-like RNA helicase
VREQLVQFCEKHKIPLSSAAGNVDKILQAFTSGYFMQAAVRQADGSFKSIAGRQQVSIHPASILFGTRAAECIIFHEVTLTSKCYLRGVSAVDAAWILEQTKNKSTKN